MDLLTAHELFARRTNRAALPVQATIGGVDVWPSAATAAVMLAGYLDDALTDEDLDEGLAHFDTLAREGIVTDEAYRELIGEVLDTFFISTWKDETAAAPLN